MVAPLLAALGLALVHVFAGRLRRHLDGVPRSIWLSFAGGVPVAFVFLQILPTLARDQERIESAGVLPFLGRHAYVLALVGMFTFYAVERHVKRSRAQQREQGRDVASDEAFWVAITLFSMMNLMIGYLVIDEERPLHRFALFWAAMALKFVVNDFGLHDNHKENYDRLGRWIAGAAVLAGWAVGYMTTVPPAALSTLRGFIVGAVVMNVMKEELPEERRSRIWPLLLSAAIYGSLLLAL